MRYYTNRKRRATESIGTTQRDNLECIAEIGQFCASCIQLGLALILVLFTLQAQPCNGDEQEEPQAMLAGYIARLLPWVSGSIIAWTAMKDLDQALGDIPEDAEHSPRYSYPEKFHFINDFQDDNESDQHTGFTKHELHILLFLFDLPAVIRVGRGDGYSYTFGREQLLIYSLIKMTSGTPSTRLADGEVGGKSSSRLDCGHKWLMKYLDNRYHHLIGPNGLSLWVDQFPYFAEKIRHLVTSDKRRVHPITGFIEVQPGLWFDPGSFNVAGFVDCKDYEICRPHSGPAGNYPGAQRRPHWDLYQRAFFGGHHWHHAVKFLVFLLPNGLFAAVYGPASARRHDSTLVHWSTIDQILQQVQLPRFRGVYTFYGDPGFRGPWVCIRSKHEYKNGPPVTPRQHAEDKVMSSARVRIEHQFGNVVQKFTLVDRKEHFKLEKDADIIGREIHVAHLLDNILTCIKGNSVSGRHGFDCIPPPLETYLSMGMAQH